MDTIKFGPKKSDYRQIQSDLRQINYHWGQFQYSFFLFVYNPVILRTNPIWITLNPGIFRPNLVIFAYWWTSIGQGLLRVAPQSQIHIGATRKLQFPHCFGLKALQIRAVSFKRCDFFILGAKISSCLNLLKVSACMSVLQRGVIFFSITKSWSEKLVMNSNFC